MAISSASFIELINSVCFEDFLLDCGVCRTGGSSYVTEQRTEKTSGFVKVAAAAISFYIYLITISLQTV